MSWFINAILHIEGSDYHCINSLISKNETLINKLDNLNAKCWFDQKKWNIIKHKNLLSHIKMGKEILMFKDIEKIKKINLHQKKKGSRY